MLTYITIISLILLSKYDSAVGLSFSNKPHIIVIVADDLGWNDVEFHGSSQIPTPNINALAYAGVILNNYYVQPICTPSRSALLSGMHPIHTGLNHDVIYGAQPFGLPLKFNLITKYLKTLGFKCHAVGKWHIGMFIKEYTPIHRGFRSHYGYWTGHEDYYSHTSMEGHGTIGAPHPYALPLSFKLLPQYLNEFKYNSKIIGKWHLGLYKKVYTPLFRGFQSHYGYWNGRVDYYSRTSYERHETIGGPDPYGLPLNFSLLPHYLKTLKYLTRHVGKWHIGSFKRDYTPTFRGFDSHYGYWTGRIDYYDHTAFEHPGWWGYDFRRDMNVDREGYGKYTTDLFTNEAIQVIERHNSSEPLFLYLAHLAVHSGNPYDPLQAPSEIVKKFSYIKDENRRKFAAMLWKLDESVGKVVKALEDASMLENSIIVFTTDNGGPAAGFNSNAASNWPLRGVKASMWEGGVRGAAFVWSSLLQNPGRVSTEMMQITDWLPTLYRAAGGNPEDLPPMDGMDMWESIRYNAASPRHEILHNIDPILGGAGIRVGDWKLVFNPSGYGPHWDGWFGPSGRLPNDSLKRNVEEEINLIRESMAGKAVKKHLLTTYENMGKLKKSAQVLCHRPVPSNATRTCNDSSNPCLFHIPSDPCEYFDVSEKYPDRVQILQERLQAYNDTAVSPGNKPWDPDANPVYWSYTWTHWKDFEINPVAKIRRVEPPNEIEPLTDHIWL